MIDSNSAMNAVGGARVTAVDHIHEEGAAVPFSFATVFDAIRDAAMPAPRIAVAAAEEPEVLSAVSRAAELGIVRPILVADRVPLECVARETKIDLDAMTVIPVAEKGPVYDRSGAAAEAVRLVSSGEADILMKGLLDTPVMLKAVLDREHGLRTGRVLSHFAIFEIEGFPRPLAMSDGAMNIEPDLETKEAILRNGVEFMQRIGYAEPKVAVLAAKEKVNPKMQATVDAAELARRSREGEIGGCIVDGPFALDNAVSLASARIKGISSSVAGHADFLLVPRIESGNILYKALAFLTRSRHAGLILGARAPVVLTSRADSEAAKLDSIALAALSVMQGVTAAPVGGTVG